MASTNPQRVGFSKRFQQPSEIKKTVNKTGIDKIPIKCDCIGVSFVFGVRELILLSFPLEKPEAHKYTKNLELNFFTKCISVLSHISFHLKDDDHKAVDFNLNRNDKFYLSTHQKFFLVPCFSVFQTPLLNFDMWMPKKGNRWVFNFNISKLCDAYVCVSSTNSSKSTRNTKI